jgi:hypothetical protein
VTISPTRQAPRTAHRTAGVQVFLGDVGSLPIGLLLGWLLVQLAAMSHLAAATITLASRVVRGEAFWQASRTRKIGSLARSAIGARRLGEKRNVLPARWSEALFRDPYYSPNLTDDREDFSVRVH